MKKLTRTQLIEYIRNTMPDGLTELEKAAFIEKAVADNVVFDEAYLWSDHETRRKIYKLAKEEAQRPKEEIKRKLICTTMSELYVYVARKFGLDIEYQRTTVGKNQEPENEIGGNEVLDKISEDKLEHVCPILNLKDGRRIRVDIQGDLANLQTRSKAIGFGTKDDDSDIEVLPEEEIDSIFRKIYGLNEGEKFTDDYITDLILKMKGKEPIEKIEGIIEDERIQRELQFTGCVEAKKLFDNILQQALGTKIFGTYFGNGVHAHISTCSLTQGAQNKKYSFLLYADDEYEKLFYVFSRKSKKLVRITPEELHQMKKMSMKITPIIQSKADLEIKTLKFISEAIDSYESDKQENPTSVDMEYFFEDDEEPEQ